MCGKLSGQILPYIIQRICRVNMKVWQSCENDGVLTLSDV